MSAITEQKEILEDIQTAKFITSTLRDISALKVQSIREEFQKNNAFYNEIRELYSLVKAQSQQAEQAEAKRKQEKENGGKDVAETGTKKQVHDEIAVAVTSNKRFYGTLNTDVMEKLTEYLEVNKESDCLVIGNTGNQYLQETPYVHRCNYISFTEDDPTAEEIVSLMGKLDAYKKVLVFYPKFVNVFRQDVAKIDITHTPEPVDVEKSAGVEYIFEPELSELLHFFETQVRHLLFNRVMLEAELARTAARLIKMQQAEQRADEVMEERQLQMQKEINSLSSMRLLETFAGFKQWKK